MLMYRECEDACRYCKILQELGLWFVRKDNVQGSAWMFVTGLSKGGGRSSLIRGSTKLNKLWQILEQKIAWV